ncbi:MAG: carboxypeptidase-like regulatory domain-containing protein [Patescibacteria group bacterium]|nr:carboxypeptidase-like regulatory domain-containing protein [Patescibacteria group bacterium]
MESPERSTPALWRTCLPWLGCAAILLTAIAGCGDGGLALVPAAGVVTLDGEPVAEAGVIFTPVDGGPAASGSTDSEGRFQLHTVNRPGTVPGLHTATVTKQQTTGLGDFGAVGPEGVKTIWHVPEKYSNPKTSGLEFEVGRDSGNLRIELSSR